MELLYTLMHPLPNAIMTVLMGVMFLYWLVSFVFGAMDLDIGLDFDHDFDIDAGVPDVGHHEPGMMVKTLEFFNIGKMPFMLLLTIFLFFIWVGSLVFTSFIDITSWEGFSVLILIPLTICSLFLTKFASKPFIKLFLAMGYQGEDAIEFLGRSGSMISTIEGNKIGAATFKIDGNPIRLNVKSKTGELLARGEFVVIEEEGEAGRFFYVSKELSLRNF